MNISKLSKKSPTVARLLSAMGHKTAIAGLLSASIVAAGAANYTTDTVGTYNANNKTVFEATGNSMDMATFSNDVVTAFAEGTGGVWSFENASFGLNVGDTITLNYGAALTNSLVLTLSGGNNINQAFNTGEATSGSYVLGFGGDASTRVFTPNKPLLAVGVFNTDRNDPNRFPVLTVTYLDNSTASTAGANADNVYFHGLSGTGANPIVKFEISQNNFVRYDDLGFIVSTTALAPQITTQPVGQNIYQGEDLQLTAFAIGANLVFQWKAGAPGSGIYTNVPTATNATLIVPSVTTSLDYVLSITNMSGSVTSDVASVTVLEPTYVNGLFNGDFELPGTGKINAGFDVSGANNVPGWRNAGTNQNDTGIESAGSGNNSTYAAYLHRGQSGAYQITTNVLHQGDSVTLTWYERDSYLGVNRKVSLLSASSQTAAFDSTTILTAVTNEVTGWWTQKNLNYVAGAGDAGKFLGVAFQSADPATATGWANFDDFSVTVTPAAAAPVIITHPTSRTAWLGGATTFTVVASGSGLSYQWQAGAVGGGVYTNISDGGQFSGAGTASLTISNIVAENGLDYVVVVSNTGGATPSTPATLTVDPSAAFITSQPVSAARFTSESVTFTVGATGGVNYQWKAGAVGSGIYTNLSNGGQFAGVNTATLTITNLQKANEADYVVDVSNGGGGVTSDPATLTVTTVIYAQNFETTETNLNTLGWAADSQSGNVTIAANPSAGGRCIFDGNSQASMPQAFYTSAGINNAFPIIKLSDVPVLTFSVDLQSWWHGEVIHSYFAVQMNLGQWYVSTSELPQPTGTQTTLPMTFDPGSYAWNELTVSGAGGFNTASVPVIGPGAAADLTGYVTGAGVVTIHANDLNPDGSSWVSIDNFRIYGDGFVAYPGLSLAKSGAGLVLSWGYGTLFESSSLMGPWTPVSGTSPKAVSTTDESHFYRLQLP